MKQLNLTTATGSTLEIINGVPMMSSRNIAEVTGKKPAHIVRDIESMLESLGKHYPELDNYDSTEFSIKRKTYNGRLVIDEIWLNETLSMTLVTGYDACRRLALVEQWQEMKQELSQPRIAAQPAQQELSMNHDILSLARVVAEATASATMKALMEVTGIQALTHVQAVAKPVQPEAEAEEPEIHDYPLDPSYEFIPIVKIAWDTTFSDAACRRLIEFASLPVRKLEGVRGLCVHMESFLDALKELIAESTPPTGKLKRWQHPEFGGFTLRKKPEEIFGEAK
ncbi:TPA: Rha family transcriptional regulator [Salmonella enterica subsp. enterica serovar Birkenhead]